VASEGYAKSLASPLPVPMLAPLIARYISFLKNPYDDALTSLYITFPIVYLLDQVQSKIGVQI
jgi:hypothetical protein